MAAIVNDEKTACGIAQRFQRTVPKPWDPLCIKEVAVLFADSHFPWWIAGGHAIEQFVGSAFRSHDDIDVLILRRDSTSVRNLLDDWDMWMADPPGKLRPWPGEEPLPEHVSDIWCRKHADDPWRFQIMVDKADGPRWKSRRSSGVSMPVVSLGFHNQDNAPFLTPEVQLFYKAKSPRPKDLQDLERCLPLMTNSQKEWLRRSIKAAYGDARGVSQSFELAIA